jgi:hypothetical protein
MSFLTNQSSVGRKLAQKVNYQKRTKFFQSVKFKTQFDFDYHRRKIKFQK